MTALRALAAGAAIVAASVALGLPAVPALQPGSAVAGAATGQVGAQALTPAIMTDGRALVPFGRTMVRTVAKDGRAPLNVASAQLSRPPEGSLMAPLEMLAASSPFGFRISPISGLGGDFHLGQDFAASCGTRVYAADAGVVRAAGWHPWGGGNRVEIDHGNGLITTYNHLAAIAVRTGDAVQVGQVIARVGTTGWSTGCHLHFETILRGVHTNPLDWSLLPIRQVDVLADIAMVSYEGKAADAATTLPWAIPVAADNSHAVLHGEDELPEPPAVAGTGPTTAAKDSATSSAAPPPTAAATSSPSGTATSSPSGTSTPSGTATSSPSGTATSSPSGTATSSPSGTATSSPSGTATSSPSGTSTPSDTATSAETSTPAATTPAASETSTPAATSAPAVTSPPASGTSTPAATTPPPAATTPPPAGTSSPAPTTAPTTPTPAAPVTQSSPAGRDPSESEQPADAPTSSSSAAAAPPGTAAASTETTAKTATPEPTPPKP